MTAWPQSYYTGKVDFGNKTYGCWLYEDASVIINRAIKSYELEERNKNLSLINDSLMLAFQIQTDKFEHSQEALSICISKEQDFNIIEQGYQQEVDIWKGEAKTQKNHKLIAAGIALLMLTLAITK